jgi:hypothetical protein
MIRRRTSGARACSSALLLLGALGCGDSGTSKPDSDAALDVNPMGGMDMGSMAGMDMGPMISCEGDSRVSMYMDGLTRAGLAGAVQVKITSASPSPPANGYNTWTVQILDRLGNPMAGTLSVIPDMPDHGHVSPQTPVITPGASIGAYTVSNLYLFMAGVWRIQISISSGTAADGGALLDIVTFFFCVQG